MSNASRASWICCQLGAREHYAVARALHRQNALGALVVDAWAPPGTKWRTLPGEPGRRLAERYSSELASAAVIDFTASLVTHEAAWQLRGLAGWPRVVARNKWFQRRAAATLPDTASDAKAGVVFAHSYAALDIVRRGRARGLTVVLGQIDPGPAHVDMLRALSEKWPEFGAAPSEPGPSYFDDWREECAMADWVVVNSDWSRESLMRAGVDSAKVRVIPLPYEAEASEPAFERRYPAAFDASRPLRALFVGSIATFKGVPELLTALDLLGGAPIELLMVGPMAATIPDRFQNDPRIRWVGAVARSTVMSYYRQADVLVFPSHSDGFGMAQIEAQAWRLPIIASRSSGRVVEEGVNGWLLPEVSAEAIATALAAALDPDALWPKGQHSPHALSLDGFGTALMKLAERD